MAVGPSQWLRRVCILGNCSCLSVVFHPTFDAPRASKQSPTHYMSLPTWLIVLGGLDGSRFRVWFVDKRSRFSVVFHPTFDVRAISKGNKTVSHILQVTTNMVDSFGRLGWQSVPLPGFAGCGSTTIVPVFGRLSSYF